MLEFLYEPYRIGTQFGFVLVGGDSKSSEEGHRALIKKSRILRCEIAFKRCRENDPGPSRKMRLLRYAVEIFEERR
jgi:hypothetical protein